MPKLLQRPSLMPGEWWESYVVRVLLENGHAPNGRYMLRKLEPLVTATVASDVKRDAQAGDRIREGLHTFSVFTLPRWAVRGHGAATAYCPECFRNAPYIRLSWRLNSVTHCETHGCPMQACCGACGSPVFHWQLAGRFCRCGADIAQSPGTKSPSSVVPSLEPVLDEQNLLFSAQCVEDLVSAEGDGKCSRAGAIATVAFLGALLPSLAAARMTGIKWKEPTVSGLLSRLSLSAVPSVAWVEQLWQALPSAAHLRNALLVVLRLHHDELSSPSDLSVLPLWQWAQTLSGLGASSATAERRGWVSVGALAPRLYSASSVSRQTGITERQLAELMAKGVAIPTRTLMVGVRQHQFSPETVHELQRLRDHECRYGRYGNLGVEGNGLKILAKTDVVDLATGNGERRRLDRSQMRALLDGLNSRAAPIDQLDSAKVSLGSKRIWQSPYIPVLKEMFSRLLSGELQLWVCGKAPGLARFHVGLDTLEFLHRGALGKARSGTDAEIQPELPLFGGKTSWAPKPQTWRQPPRIGKAHSREAQALQPSLLMVLER
jgi:hypothetical protein